MMAVNDSSWLISLANDLLNDEFRNHPCYTDIVGLLHMVTSYINTSRNALSHIYLAMTINH